MNDDYDHGVDDKELVSAIWERRVKAWQSGEPLEMALADLMVAGLTFVGTDQQRLLLVELEGDEPDEDEG